MSESFYRNDLGGGEAAEEVLQTGANAGFTEEELADILNPLNQKWNPQREYEESMISRLIPGPRAVNFVGRVVYINSALGRSQKQPKAAGWHNLIIKDDTGAILIKLYFANQQYPLKLGQLLTVWTVFISNASKDESNMILGIGLCANLFPGRVTSDHIMIHTTHSADRICRRPLDYQSSQPLEGLMTLDSYTSSGGPDGVTGIKLLVCVKSIGAKRRISKKAGGESDLADVVLFDHTGEVRITVWNELIESAKSWQAGRTILLISNPGWVANQFAARGKVGITRSTIIDVDSDLVEGGWLRRYVAGLARKEAVCPEFPQGVWDLESTKGSPVRILFTLKDIDEWVRPDPENVFSGWINIVILENGLVLIIPASQVLPADVYPSQLWRTDIL